MVCVCVHCTLYTVQCIVVLISIRSALLHTLCFFFAFSLNTAYTIFSSYKCTIRMLVQLPSRYQPLDCCYSMCIFLIFLLLLHVISQSCKLAIAENLTLYTHAIGMSIETKIVVHCKLELDSFLYQAFMNLRTRVNHIYSRTFLPHSISFLFIHIFFRTFPLIPFCIRWTYAPIQECSQQYHQQTNTSLYFYYCLFAVRSQRSSSQRLQSWF